MGDNAMAFAINCECGRQLKVNSEHAGKRGKCPACGKVFTIPAIVGQVVAPPPRISSKSLEQHKSAAGDSAEATLVSRELDLDQNSNESNIDAAADSKEGQQATVWRVDFRDESINEHVLLFPYNMGGRLPLSGILDRNRITLNGREGYRSNSRQ
jgi:hypothetical protein